jgi:hypothetical protein
MVGRTPHGTGRCPGTWWAPPPSKRLGRAIPVRRVRFPSTSANGFTGVHRREQQANDRAATGDAWPTVVYDGEHIDLVFTTLAGRPMLRQHVDKAIRSAAIRAGLDPTGLGTHTGRRSVVTNLYASGTFDLADVAGFVGHSDTATTRGYIQHEGERPLLVSQKALQLLDPAAPAPATTSSDQSEHRRRTRRPTDQRGRAFRWTFPSGTPREQSIWWPASRWSPRGPAIPGLRIGDCCAEPP